MLRVLTLSLLLSTPLIAEPVVLNVPKGMGQHFVDTCLANDVPIVLAHRLIEWESGWNEQAWNVNSDGTRDLGIMQLNNRYYDDFAHRYNGGEPIDPWMWRTSMSVGIQHLANLYRVLGSWEAAVAAYNVGLTRYRKGRLPHKTLEMVEYVTYIGIP